MEESAKIECEFHPDELLVKLDLQLPGDAESIQPAVDEIMQIVGEQECATGAEFEVEVALLEALANAVEHGCRGDSSKTIEVCVACELDRGMLIIVRDPGTGFDPRTSRARSPARISSTTTAAASSSSTSSWMTSSTAAEAPRSGCEKSELRASPYV